MNILFVAAHYHPYIGGVEYVVKSVAERLVKLGHEVIVLAGEPTINKPRNEEINGVQIIRWPTWAPGNAYHIPRLRNKLKETFYTIMKYSDVVHVHSAHAVLPVYVGIKVKELHSSIKLVFTLHYHAHGHTLIRELAWRALWHKYVAKLLRYADIIQAVSIAEAKHIIQHYPEVKDKIIIIPNGVEEDTFQYRWKGYNSDYILYAGRIEKYKQLEVAIDFIRELNKYGYDLKLIIAGQGSYLPRLKQYSRKKAAHKVQFISPQPRKKYLNLIANAYATINPSYYEAFSIFTAESLAIGTPAIVSYMIAKIYSREKHVYHPLLAKLYFLLNRFKLSILPSDNQEGIRSWNDIVRRALLDMYQGKIPKYRLK